LLAFALQEMANHYYEWGRTEEAQQTRYECLMLFRGLNHRHGLKFELTNAAGYAMDAGDLEEGERLIHESLIVNREIDNPRALCYALSRAGVLAEIRGDDAEAERLAQETLIQAERDPHYYLSQAHIFLAWAFCIQGDFTAAAKAQVGNLRGLLGNGQITLLVWTLPGAVWILAARGQIERAIELLGLAVHTRPGEIQRWDMRPHWRSLLEDLEAELGSEVYQAAFERGKALDLEAAITDMIEELADAD
jgi:tetratricopeptide (TPR) repeat protein